MLPPTVSVLWQDLRKKLESGHSDFSRNFRKSAFTPRHLSKLFCFLHLKAWSHFVVVIVVVQGIPDMPTLYILFCRPKFCIKTCVRRWAKFEGNNYIIAKCQKRIQQIILLSCYRRQHVAADARKKVTASLLLWHKFDHDPILPIRIIYHVNLRYAYFKHSQFVFTNQNA